MHRTLNQYSRQGSRSFRLRRSCAIPAIASSATSDRTTFRCFEGGKPRPIVDFGANDQAPINVAFLLDTSGSMSVASNMARAKDFVEEFVGGIEPAADEVRSFTFDKSLRREVSFTNDRDNVYDALYGVKPWGLTSLLRCHRADSGAIGGPHLGAASGRRDYRWSRYQQCADSG